MVTNLEKDLKNWSNNLRNVRQNKHSHLSWRRLMQNWTSFMALYTIPFSTANPFNPANFQPYSFGLPEPPKYVRKAESSSVSDSSSDSGSSSSDDAAGQTVNKRDKNAEKSKKKKKHSKKKIFEKEQKIARNRTSHCLFPSGFILLCMYILKYMYVMVSIMSKMCYSCFLRY